MHVLMLVCMHACMYLCMQNEFPHTSLNQEKRCWNQEPKSRLIHGEKMYKLMYIIIYHISYIIYHISYIIYHISYVYIYIHTLFILVCMRGIVEPLCLRSVQRCRSGGSLSLHIVLHVRRQRNKSV